MSFASHFAGLDVIPKPDARASFFVLVDEDHTGVLERLADSRWALRGTRPRSLCDQ
jgi:hypothetical protein